MAQVFEAREFLKLWEEQGADAIASKLGLSRATVFRLKAKARDLVDGTARAPRGPGGIKGSVRIVHSAPLPQEPADASPDSVAQGILAEIGTRVLYDGRLKMWYVFTNGPTYEADAGKTAPRVRALVRRAYAARAARAGPPTPADIAIAVNVLQDLVAASLAHRQAAESIDTDFCLIPFANGVYDTREGCFRAGVPTDLLSRRAPVDYVPYGEIDPGKRKELEEHLGAVHGAQLPQALDTLAAALTGGKKELLLLHGDANSGKSSQVRLVRLAFGPLVCTLPESCLTRLKPISPTTACDYMVPMVGARIGVLNEPEPGARLNGSVLKQLTGQDEISFRASRGVQVAFTYHGSLWMVTNFLPDFSQDPALESRCKVLSHTAQLAVDPGVAAKLPDMAQAFGSLLVSRLT